MKTEWYTRVSFDVHFYRIDQLVTGYAKNSTAKKMVDDVDWYVVPVVNPDGFAFTHQGVSVSTFGFFTEE